MIGEEDWLQDPLMKIGKGSFQYLELKSLDKNQYDLWQSFHFATRLKLNGASFFCTKVIDTARTSEDVQLEWYLDAFFFELMAACDTLLQELNIIYAYDLGLKPEHVRWNSKEKNKFMKRLPEVILNHIEAERRKDWFCEVQWYRNTTTHHYRIPKNRSKLWWGHDSLHPTYYVDLRYTDKEGKIKIKEISICKDYLSNMVNYISSVWGKMAQEFQ
ncbi:hypothetical protein ES703_92890 [subsurface metagenome]